MAAVTLWVRNWPACDETEVSVWYRVYHKGSYAASLGARFRPNGEMVSGDLEDGLA